MFKSTWVGLYSVGRLLFGRRAIAASVLSMLLLWATTFTTKHRVKLVVRNNLGNGNSSFTSRRKKIKQQLLAAVCVNRSSANASRRKHAMLDGSTRDFSFYCIGRLAIVVMLLRLLS